MTPTRQKKKISPFHLSTCQSQPNLGLLTCPTGMNRPVKVLTRARVFTDVRRAHRPATRGHSHEHRTRACTVSSDIFTLHERPSCSPPSSRTPSSWFPPPRGVPRRDPQL